MRMARPEDKVKVDPARSTFPHCIVWSPLPVLTWILPCVGHMGIADTRGKMYDFAGPYMIGKGSLAFGPPTRYIMLEPAKCKAPDTDWDAAVADGCEVYSGRVHNLICDNCHSHVAYCLNLMEYAGCKRWNMVILAAWVFFKGQYTSWGAALQTWLPFILIVTVICVWRGLF